MDSVEQTAADIQAKIANLANFDGDHLRGEMASLKKALTENPSAAALLQDEDIGAAVAALRRIVGIAVATASAPKERKPRAKKFTAAELQKALEEVSDDDL